MRMIALTILACAIPAGLFAQQTKLLEIKVPEEASAAASAEPKAVPEASKPAEVKVSAPAKQAAEIIPVIKPGPVPVKTKKPAAAVKPAAAAKPAVSKPAEAKIPSRRAKPGERAVLPKEDPASTFMPSELVSEAGIPQTAIKAGGFLVGVKHRVNRGDTLWALSGRYYKDPFLWGRIYNANYKTVSNPDRIHPKEELIIPDLNEIVVPYRRPAMAGSENIYAEEEGAEVLAAAGLVPAGYAPVALKNLPPEPGEILMDFDRNFLSEEMPEQQREWSDGIKIVPDSWSEDGEITAKLKGDSDSMDDSFSLSGELIEISMNSSATVRPGDYLAVYLKGGDAYDKSGNRLGRELQPAGLAEVVSVDGSSVRARVIDATTAIAKGYIVKKK